VSCLFLFEIHSDFFAFFPGFGILLVKNLITPLFRDGRPDLAIRNRESLLIRPGQFYQSQMIPGCCIQYFHEQTRKTAKLKGCYSNGNGGREPGLVITSPRSEEHTSEL